MARYYSKRNKKKVWRDSYGKPYLRRLTVARMHAAINAVCGLAQIRAISSTQGCVDEKSLAMAKVAINTVNSVVDTLSKAKEPPKHTFIRGVSCSGGAGGNGGNAGLNYCGAAGGDGGNGHKGEL